jgi:hypothetical protein
MKDMNLDQLKDIDLYGRIILKWISNGMSVWTGFNCLILVPPSSS